MGKQQPVGKRSCSASLVSANPEATAAPTNQQTAAYQHRLAHAAGSCQAGIQHALCHVAARQDLVHRQPPLQRHQLLIRLSGLQGSSQQQCDRC